MTRPPARWIIFPACLCLAGILFPGATSAEEAEDGKPDNAEDAPAELNDLEQAFADLMSGCVLVGTFSVDGKDDAPPDSDRYEITGASKVKDDDWMIHARVVFGDIDVVVPVPVKMHWAGDTPVLSVTDLELPLIGSQFSARVLFDGDRYAGTWAHGKVGGHMWGMIEQADDSDE